MAETKQKVKEKIDGEIAEGMDNKASFKDILRSIDPKRQKEKTLCNYVESTVKRKNRSCPFYYASDYLLPSQPRNVFSEDWEGALNQGFFETFSHKSLMPWMVTTAHNIGKPDPVTLLLKNRWKWVHEWEKFKIGYAKMKRITYKWFDDDVLYCPKFFTKMAEHLVNPPDPMLEEAYNWYYAGKGNLQITHVDGSDYLVYSELNSLYISPFFKDNLSIDYSNTSTYHCPEDTYILETIQSQNFIAIRTKHKVIILKVLSADAGLKLEKSKEMDSELPFTSITFDEFHKNILYVTTLDCQLTIVNLDRMTGRNTKLRGKVSTLTDNWSCVIGSDRGHYAHVTRKAVTLYDKRNNEAFQRWKNFALVSDVYTCGKVSAAKYCQGTPLMYIATDHHLFLMDLRCTKTKEGNIKAIQRWTHGMQSTPTYIDICAYDHDAHKDMICLSSQWVEDLCLVSNYSDTLTRKGEIRSLALPYRPPSILQTYNEALTQRLCCSLYEPIQPRLCTAITGVSVMQHGQNCVVLQQNSLGDVTCHTLYPVDMLAFIDNDSLERLHQWSQDFKHEAKPLEVSNMADIKIFLSNLKRVPDDYVLGRNTAINEKVKFNETEIYETYEKQELDPEFLTIWKDTEEEITLDKTGMGQFFTEE